MYLTKVQNTKREILENPKLKSKSAHFSILQRKRANLGQDTNFQSKANSNDTQALMETSSIGVNTEKNLKSSAELDDDMEYEGDDEDDQVDGTLFEAKGDVDTSTQSSSEASLTREQILEGLQVISKPKQIKAAEILDLIISSRVIAIRGSSGFITVQNEPTQLKIIPFLYDLQQPTRKLQPVDDYRRVLRILELSPNQVGNTYAKNIVNQIQTKRITRQNSQEGETSPSDVENDQTEEDTDGDGKEQYYTIPRERKETKKQTNNDSWFAYDF